MLMDHMRIGLLGGSFNPAHEGHIHLSMEAKKRLRLDRVIWLVSPQNPLKRKQDIAPYDTRLEYALWLTHDSPAIEVSDIEAEAGLYYSIDTVAALQHWHPRTRFIWLMGADNLANFHRWRCWQQMFELIPIAVFDRAPFSHAALHQPAAKRYQKRRFPESLAPLTLTANTPCWSYHFMPRHPLSATYLRKTLGKRAFFMQN